MQNSFITNKDNSVALSRKTNITQLIDAKKLEADPEIEHKEFGPRKIVP